MLPAKWQTHGMARPLRFEVENGWHHVKARGNERRDIFRDDDDRCGGRESEFLAVICAVLCLVVWAPDRSAAAEAKRMSVMKAIL